MESTIRTGVQFKAKEDVAKKKNVSAPINTKTANEADKLDLSTKLEKAKKQNGLIEKIADKIKGATNIGYSSKKIEKTLEKVKTGEVTEEQADKEIKKYRASQENTAQAVGDVISATASMTAMFKTKQALEILSAKYLKVNDGKEIIDTILDIPIFKNKKGLADFVKNNISKRGTYVAIGTAGAILAGAFSKALLLKINRIGTKQYKPEINKETMSKQEIKKAKKEAKKARKNAGRRNLATGAINGLMTPIISTLGIVGAPIYVLGNSLSRYFIGTREDKGNKNFKNYIENIKTSAITHAASAVAIVIPAIKQGKFNKIFEKNIDEVVKNLKDAKLEQVSMGKSSYAQLEDIMFNNNKISEIMGDEGLSVSEKIQKLSDENIFAVKFKQINSNADDLARALKTECPPTRTLDEAQEVITKTFGDKYKVEKCVGVGTVAETYLVKEGDKEFCIKILKNGITAEKITKDKEKFIEIIQNLEGKTEQEKSFLIKNVENIADGVLAEVDLKNEMSAAQELAKVTKKAQLVKPITVKDNIYVMEKASGITLSDFSEYNDKGWRFKDRKTGKIMDRNIFSDALENARKTLEEERAALAKEEQESWKEIIKRNIKTYEAQVKDYEKKLKDYDKFVELDKLGLGELSEKEVEKMLGAYQNVIVEQFSKVDKNGKIIHGDIHPGNIFIDVPALKAGKKDFFTLIDTGNTIKQSQESAMRFLNLSNYIKNADYENIADFVLEGASLPEGLTKGKAKEEIIEELKKAFFDNKTYTGPLSNDNILNITDGIMQKLNIIPADTQGNLMKSKTSSLQSMEEFWEAFRQALVKRIEGIEDEKEIMKKLFGMLKKFGKNKLKYPIKQTMQERKNLLKLTPKDKMKLTKSKSTPAKNSVDYLTYIIKQAKKLPAEDHMAMEMFS